MIFPTNVLKDLFIYVTVPVFTLFYWRGTWNLCDQYFYPNDLKASAWLSLAVGYIGAAIFFTWQYCFYNTALKKLFDLTIRETGIVSMLLLLMGRVETYVVAYFVVNAWRGLWLLQEVYLITEHPLLSAWVSHIIGAVCLMLLGHMQSVFAPPIIMLPDSDTTAIRLKCLQRLAESEGTEAALPAVQYEMDMPKKSISASTALPTIENYSTAQIVEF